MILSFIIDNPCSFFLLLLVQGNLALLAGIGVQGYLELQGEDL